MKIKSILIAITLGLGLPAAFLWLIGSGKSVSASTAAELHVCPSGCAYSSIQTAVDAASSNDIIKVATGIYTDVHVRPRHDIVATGFVTQVVYISKTVSIKGGYTTPDWVTPDPVANPTTLDAGQYGRVYITGDISPTIEGMQITGGNARGLGGDGSFFGQDTGGGIYVITATATIRNNQIFSNIGEYGGGIYLGFCAGTMSKNKISENISSGEGGGLGLYESSTLIDHNNITQNTSSWGGGLYLHSSPATLENNVISNNIATGRGGGGLFLWWSDAIIKMNKITANTSPWNTNGGLHVFSSAPELTNNIIIDNQGGGIRIEGDSQSRLLHNTIADNGSDGIGIYVTHYVDLWGNPMYASAILTNTILVDHSVGISVTGGNEIALNGLLWYSTPITISQSTTATVSVLNQLIGDPAFANDGYHLMPGSMAADAGINTDVLVDIDGEMRPAGTSFDLGADELWYTIALPLVMK